MKKYALINDGIITQTIFCQEDELQYYEGDKIECGNDISSSTHYYKDGFKLFPERNNSFTEFDVESEQWVLSGTEQEQNEVALNLLRGKRAKLLLECDWTQVADAPVDKQAWQAYRQALRDLPSNYDTITNINDVEWPVPPQEM